MYMCLIAYLYIYISNEMEREKTENKEISMTILFYTNPSLYEI